MYLERSICKPVHNSTIIRRNMNMNMNTTIFFIQYEYKY